MVIFSLTPLILKVSLSFLFKKAERTSNSTVPIPALEKRTRIDLVQTRSMKIVFLKKDPRLKVSLRHSGMGVFLNFSSPNRHGGAPSGMAVSIILEGII